MLPSLSDLPEFPDLPILKHDQQATLESLKNGEIKDLRVSQKAPVDSIVNFGLNEGLIQEGLETFPDPRKTYDIPIDVLLLPQIIQRLNNEHSLVSAPYMLNSAELMVKLGYNAEVISEGFNNKNTYPRETPFHGETLKHVLLSLNAEVIIKWFNDSWGPLLAKFSPGRTRQYLMDGMKIHIPSHLSEKFQDSGMVKNSKGEYKYGYKVVWIYEIIDRKGVIRGLNFGPINTHDLELGKELVEDFNFEKNSVLTMDRGFFDGEWISCLKNERGIDVCIPLKKNTFLSELAVWNTLHEGNWKDHPTRKGQFIRELSLDELEWDHCPVFKSGVLVEYKKKNKEKDHILVADTRGGISSEVILETYDLRSEIEEAHRQMKVFQGIEKLPSKKYIQVVFRVVMGLIGYNLFNLFLNSQGCSSFKDYTLKLFRQKRRSIQEEKNPEMIIYTEKTFATIKMLDFLQLILGLKKNIQKKIQSLLGEFSMDSNMDHGPSP